MQNQPKSPQSMIMMIQAFFLIFALSVVMLGGVAYLIACAGTTPPEITHTNDTQISQMLFYVGLGLLLFAQYAWSTIFDRDSKIMKPLLRSGAESLATNLAAFTTLVIVCCALTESSAILGLVILMGSSCGNYEGWLLIGVALITFILRLPSKSKIEELLK